MNNQRSDPGPHRLYTRAEYRVAAHELHQLPDDAGIEVAFAGRSNAGKSTAINAITRRRGLARTSKTPGRTQQIVIFDLDADRRLADLPGYGYAKVPPAVKRHWEKTLDRYLRERQSLRGLVLIMDVRHPLKPFDVQMLRWCQAAKLSCHLLLTKADKLKRGAQRQTLDRVRRALRDDGLEASVQLFSGASGDGVQAAWSVLDRWFELEATGEAAASA